MTTIYRIKSHMKNSFPDGREVVHVGDAESCDQFYNRLSHAERIEDKYLFSDDGNVPVGYYDWAWAGCSFV